MKVLIIGNNKIDYKRKFFRNIDVPDNIKLRYINDFPGVFSKDLSGFDCIIYFPNTYDFGLTEGQCDTGFMHYCWKFEHPKRYAIVAEKYPHYKPWENRGVYCYPVSTRFTKEECVNTFRSLGL